MIVRLLLQSIGSQSNPIEREEDGRKLPDQEMMLMKGGRTRRNEGVSAMNEGQERLLRCDQVNQMRESDEKRKMRKEGEDEKWLIRMTSHSA